MMPPPKIISKSVLTFFASVMSQCLPSLTGLCFIVVQKTLALSAHVRPLLSGSSFAWKLFRRLALTDVFSGWPSSLKNIFFVVGNKETGGCPVSGGMFQGSSSGLSALSHSHTGSHRVTPSWISCPSPHCSDLTPFPHLLPQTCLSFSSSFFK